MLWIVKGWNSREKKFAGFAEQKIRTFRPLCDVFGRQHHLLCFFPSHALRGYVCNGRVFPLAFPAAGLSEMGFLPGAATPAAGDAKATATASLAASLERLVSMLESGLRCCSRVSAGGGAVPDPAAAAGLADALARLKGMHRRSHTKFLRH